jgi:hypothetical protein
MAPEALGNLEYSEATDAYSFGVLLWYDTTHTTHTDTHDTHDTHDRREIAAHARTDRRD